VPLWIGYFMILSALQTAVMYFWVKTAAAVETAENEAQG